jgi:formimidoylglutamate deiminase
VGGRLFRDAQAGGAQALGAHISGARGGGIAVGLPMDLVSLDGDHPSLAARRGDALLDGWIFAARGGAVDAVWRGGRKLVSNGHHHGRAAVVSRYRRSLAGLLAQ